MTISDTNDTPLRQYQSHSRNWRENHYVYPVISRRSSGLSIGVNLNPDTVCNFDCVYCQVDRSDKPRVHSVDLSRLRDELAVMIACAKDGSLFEDPCFVDVPLDRRRIKDIAFSGDGEPTTCKLFRESVELAAALKREAGLDDAKIVLITNASRLTSPNVVAALAVMDENNGEIWAKLDAGTEACFHAINRSDLSLRDVIDNIIAAACVRPVVVQSLFVRIHDTPPQDTELQAYVDRLDEIIQAGGRIKCVQVYTVARRPAESYVTPLANDEVDHIATIVHKRTGLRAEAFYGAG